MARGIHNLDRLLEAARDVPGAARPVLDLLAGPLRDLEARIEATTTRITATRKAETGRTKHPARTEAASTAGQ